MMVKRWVFFILLSASISVIAGEAANKITVMSPASAGSTGPITISSDSKIVQDYLKKGGAKNKNTLNNNAVQKTVPGGKAIRHGKKSDLNQNKKPEEPVVVHLASPGSQPPVQNKTEKFVFQDITARGSSVARTPADLAKRTSTIESMRQTAARQR